MQELFLNVMNMSITASYVILAVLFFRMLLKRAPKKYAYLLWAVAFFRLISPVSFTSVISIFSVAPFDMSVALKDSGNRLSYIPTNIGYMEKPSVTVGIPAMNSYISGSLPKATPYASINPMQVWIFLGTIIWCLGMAGIFTYSLIEYVRIKHQMSTAIHIKSNVYASDQIPSPFILGIIHPKIYIPFGLNRREKTYILRHEIYHLKRKDHIIKLAGFLVLIIHWFNPLVWAAYVCMAKDMEMSCDEKVLSKDQSITKQYSLSLLSFATGKNRYLASPLSFGERGIKERVKNVLKIRKYSTGTILFVLTLCCTVIIACAANPINREIVKGKELYGAYAFEKQIYMNPLSSFLYYGVKEYYTFGKDSFTLINANDKQELGVSYEKAEVNEEEFNSSFILNMVITDISPYKTRYQYTLTNNDSNSFYRIYIMDDEVWLAKMHKDMKLEKDYIWSIVKIVKLNTVIPEGVVISGIKEGTEEFEEIFSRNKSTLFEGDSCYNITSEYIRNNSDYKIFKYDKSGASFLLYENCIYPLGEWFGALGVTSTELADTNGDGREELYFTNSWGSGLHRSQAGYFDPALKEVIIFDYSYENEELIVAKNDEGRLSLYGAVTGKITDFSHFNLIGTAFVTDIVYANGKISLDFQVRE